MKFKAFLLLGILLFLSCSEASERLIDNVIPEPNTLEVAIKNNTDYRFLRTKLLSDNRTFNYQIIEPNSFSEFKEMNYIYSEVEILLEAGNNYFSFTPSHYIESTKVTEGLYYFEVNISNNQTLSITRKSY